MAYLILVRHGESVWNKQGLWTGLTDISLSEKGKEESQKAGVLLKDIKIDEAYSSPLKRSTETLAEIIRALKYEVPITFDKSLNERNYGLLTGKNKWDLQKEYGEEKFQKIRRAWDYPIPGGETLKDVYNRILPYYNREILPKLKNGKNILIVAHGNSLRALIKHLEEISDENISLLEIPTGGMYIYQIDGEGKIISKETRA